MKAQRRSERGVTLIEVLIAVTLLGLLSVAMFTAMRIGLTAFGRTDDKLMANRRAAGAQRILQDEFEGFMPVMALCGAATEQMTRLPFFQGQPDAMRLISTFSLQQGWRGQPQILELMVIPAEDRGVRLVVNEIPYTGPRGAGQLCSPQGGLVPKFLPIAPGPKSFVLADKLAYCRFSYFMPRLAPELPATWKAAWTGPYWPGGVRVEMAPLDADPSRVQPISITAQIPIHRSPEIPYADF